MSLGGSGKGGWDSGEIETSHLQIQLLLGYRGKGGWDSGEIETVAYPCSSCQRLNVERVDGTQARLKH